MRDKQYIIPLSQSEKHHLLLGPKSIPPAPKFSLPPSNIKWLLSQYHHTTPHCVS